MATKITKSELDTIVRDGAIAVLGLEDNGTHIGVSTFAVPVETPEGVLYAKVAVTAAQRTDTKTAKAFNLDAAVEKYEAEIAEKTAKAEAKVAEKAAKLAAKEAKATAKAEKANG